MHAILIVLRYKDGPGAFQIAAPLLVRRRYACYTIYVLLAFGQLCAGSGVALDGKAPLPFLLFESAYSFTDTIGSFYLILSAVIIQYFGFFGINADG